MKKLNKILVILFMFIMLCNFFSVSFCASLAENTATLDSKITSEAVLIMESSTGKVVYERNGYQQKYPASTTKILTGILAIENCNLNETATASEYAIRSIPSGYTTANIQVGETLSIKDLLNALMLRSANEAAIILAEHISGSQEAFADLMNKKAEEIGCKQTHFVNSNGVHDDNHYTTAYDLALIARYCMQNETFREIVKQSSFTLPATDAYPSESRTYPNTNNLVVYDNRDRIDNYYYEYATGIKTGYTTPAKNCLISSALKDGIEYICVVLGASIFNTNEGSVSGRYVDSINLFNYAFENYSFRDLMSANSKVESIQIENATKDTKNLDLLISDDLSVYVSIDNKDTDLESNITLKENLQAPISKGDIVGTITYDVEGLRYTTDLIAGNDVVEYKTNYTWIIVISIATVLIIAIVLLKIRKIMKRKKKFTRKK